jgi:repressor LexA
MSESSVQKPLSKRQNDVLYFIRKTIAEQSIPPTVKDICAEFSFASTNAAFEVLKALEEKGYIRRTKRGASRGIQVIGAEQSQKVATTTKSELPSHIKLLTIIGSGTASNPISVFMNSVGQIAVDTSAYIVSAKQQLFACIMPDTALIGNGILEGDTLIIEQNSKPTTGNVIVALLNDSIIVRQCNRVGKEYEFTATEKGYPKIKSAVENDTSIAVLGTVIGLIRRM